MRAFAEAVAASLPAPRVVESSTMTTETEIEHRFGPYGGQYVPETLMPA